MNIFNPNAESKTEEVGAFRRNRFSASVRVIPLPVRCAGRVVTILGGLRNRHRETPPMLSLITAILHVLAAILRLLAEIERGGR